MWLWIIDNGLKETGGGMKRVGMVSLQGEWSLSGVCFVV